METAGRVGALNLMEQVTAELVRVYRTVNEILVTLAGLPRIRCDLFEEHIHVGRDRDGLQE